MTAKKMQTREHILRQALALASQVGVAGLTIGSVAEACGLSKSGMFAHFGSKEALQLAVVENAQQHFVREVFQPILTLERGLPRLQALMAAWLGRLDDGHDLPGGCPLMAAVYEFDDQPGAVRDALAAGQGWQRDTLLRLVQSACEAGQLPADTDAEVLALLLFGLVQGVHHDARLLGRADSATLARRACAILLAQPPRLSTMPR